MSQWRVCTLSSLRQMRMSQPRADTCSISSCVSVKLTDSRFCTCLSLFRDIGITMQPQDILHARTIWPGVAPYLAASDVMGSSSRMFFIARLDVSPPRAMGAKATGMISSLKQKLTKPVYGKKGCSSIWFTAGLISQYVRRSLSIWTLKFDTPMLLA